MDDDYGLIEIKPVAESDSTPVEGAPQQVISAQRARLFADRRRAELQELRMDVADRIVEQLQQDLKHEAHNGNLTCTWWTPPTMRAHEHYDVETVHAAIKQFLVAHGHSYWTSDYEGERRYHVSWEGKWCYLM